MNPYRLARYSCVFILIGVATACDLAASPDSLLPAPNSPATQPTNIQQATVPSTRSTELLKQALNNTRHSTTYRMTLNFVSGTTENGQLKQQPFLNFGAEMNGNANHVTYTGGAFNEMLGGGERIEVISIANKTYLKGSNLFGAADPDKWYFLADSTLSKPPFDLAAMLAQMADALDHAKAGGTEKLDGLDCQAWLLDFKNRAGTLIEMGSSEYNQNEFNAVDSAETRLTQCADGFVHTLTWNIQAHNQQNVNEKGSLKVSVHLFDFNATNIVITAPTGAIDLK